MESKTLTKDDIIKKHWPRPSQSDSIPVLREAIGKMMDEVIGYKFETAGCKNCPLYDGTGSEYGIWCHHPKRPRLIGHYDNGEFHEHNMEEDARNVIIYEYDKSSDTSTIQIEGESIWVENVPIEDDENNDPITPDWCPLHQQPITIVKNNQ